MKPLLTTLGILAILGALAVLTLRTNPTDTPTSEPDAAAVPPAPLAKTEPRSAHVDRARAEEDEPPPVLDAPGAWAAARAALERSLSVMYAHELAKRVPRVVELRLEGVGPAQAAAVAVVDDGARRYPLTILLARNSAGWRAVELRP